MQKKLAMAIGVFLLLTSIPAMAQPGKSTIYEMDSNRKVVLFRLERTEELKDGKKWIRSRYTEADGKDAVLEELVLDQQDRFDTLQVEQKQLGQKLSAHLKDGELQFTVVDHGKTSTDNESVSKVVISGPQVVDFIQKNWDTLQKGDAVSFRLIVLDRKETVGFKVVKADTQKDPNITEFKMIPTSFIIAALVKPLTFNFNNQSKKWVSIIGRTLPKLRKNGEFVDVDAEMVSE
jgi:hypothetical protein